MAESRRSRSNGLNERLDALEAAAAVRNAQIGDMVEVLRLMNMMKPSDYDEEDIWRSRIKDLWEVLDQIIVAKTSRTVYVKASCDSVTLKLIQWKSLANLTLDDKLWILQSKITWSSKLFSLNLLILEDDVISHEAESDLVLEPMESQTVIQADESTIEETKTIATVEHLESESSQMVSISDLEPSHRNDLELLIKKTVVENSAIGAVSIAIPRNVVIHETFNNVPRDTQHMDMFINGSMHSYAHQVFDEMFLRGRRNKEHDKTKFPKSWRFRYKLGRKKIQRWHNCSPCLAMFCELQVARFQNKKKRWSLKFHWRHKWRSKHHLHEAEMTRLDNRSLEHLLESRLFEYKEKLCKRWLRFISRSLKLFRLHTFLFLVKHKWRFKFKILLLGFEEQADERMFTRHILCCFCFQSSKGYNAWGLIVFWKQVVEPTNGRAQLHSDLELSSWFIKKKSHMCSITKTKWRQKSGALVFSVFENEIKDVSLSHRDYVSFTCGRKPEISIVKDHNSAHKSRDVMMRSYVFHEFEGVIVNRKVLQKAPKSCKTWRFKFNTKSEKGNLAHDKLGFEENSWEDTKIFQEKSKVEVGGTAFVSLFKKLTQFSAQRRDTRETSFHLWHRWKYKFRFKYNKWRQNKQNNTATMKPIHVLVWFGLEWSIFLFDQLRNHGFSPTDLTVTTMTKSDSTELHKFYGEAHQLHHLLLRCKVVLNVHFGNMFLELLVSCYATTGAQIYWRFRLEERSYWLRLKVCCNDFKEGKEDKLKMVNRQGQAATKVLIGSSFLTSRRRSLLLNLEDKVLWRREM
ncbi:unnamed protein product [Cochlearia groenlandica]